MTFRERAARAGFQVSLEVEGSPFIRELDQDVDLPRSSVAGVWASSSVMVGQASEHIDATF